MSSAHQRKADAGRKACQKDGRQTQSPHGTRALNNNWQASSGARSIPPQETGRECCSQSTIGMVATRCGQDCWLTAGLSATESPQHQLRTGWICLMRRMRKPMTDNLLPCPFCGSDTAPEIDRFCEWQYVTCNASVGGCGAGSNEFMTGSAAAAAWNTRATPPGSSPASQEEVK